MNGSLDVLVVGSGVAGLTAALRAERYGMSVGVLTKGLLQTSTTDWAQGGVAAVLDEGVDSKAQHLADTLAAGAGLCDTEATRVLVDEGPARVQELIDLGARFDRDPSGRLALAREGGHAHARVVHTGTATGREIARTLVAAVTASRVQPFEGWFAVDLIVTDGRCRGVRALDPDGRPVDVRATETVLATGGAGQLFAVTTNPWGATGDGIAMAMRAGVVVADLEFVQFHPTALHTDVSPRPLLSEALRGHGAVLRDARGARFVDELLPRDVVARAITERTVEEGTEHVWLDATGLEAFDQRFPNIARAVRDAGLDPARDWLPVAPAAHYTCGGVVTDLDGATTLPGCWAVGETACAGVHGANRLASNSLLDGLVFGARAIDAVERGVAEPSPTGVMRPVLGEPGDAVPVARIELPGAPARSEHAPGDPVELRRRLQREASRLGGTLRDEASLRSLLAEIDALRREAPPVTGRTAGELGALLDVGAALCAAALVREETRGAHTRSDHPLTDERFRLRLVSGTIPGPAVPTIGP